MTATLNGQTNGPTTYTATGTTLTYSHTVNAGSNTVLWVVAWAANAVSGVTYNGVAMSQVVSVSLDGGASAIYELKTPATGANNVVVTCGTTGNIRSQAFAFDGVDQTTPSSGYIQGYYGGTSPISESIASAAGNLGLLVMGDRGGDSNTTYAGSGGATLVGGDTQSGWATAASYLLASGSTVSPGVSYSGGAVNSIEFMGFSITSAQLAASYPQPRLLFIMP